MFRDREEAAQRLADRLKAYRGKHPLILGIPRGAVPMAKVIADQLNGDVDVVLVRKLRAPQQPEFAIGSVDESGWTYLADYARAYGGSATYIASEKQAQVDDDEVVKVL
jgi:predicted phosphoribosyltransferase